MFKLLGSMGDPGLQRRLSALFALLLIVLGVAGLFQEASAGATITVNTTADEWNNDGDCSLREAIAAANWDQPVDACTAGSGRDTISIPAGTYTLSLFGPDDYGASGDLDVLRSISIQGAGAGTTIIDGGSIDRVFDVQPYVPEFIIINEIMKNPDQVADSVGEWIELYNPGPSEVDINGWKIEDDDSDAHIIDYGSPLMVPAGGYLILASEYDPGLNGGVSVDYEYTYSEFQLANAADEVVLLDDSAFEVDRVNYDDGVLFPDPTGASMSLKLPRADNNDGANWCTSTSSFGDGDLGTPGSENDCISNPSTLIQVSISDLTVQNGSASEGGGIRNQADLSLDHVAVQSNTGSGIYHRQGSFLIADSQISGNSQSGIEAFKPSSPLLTIQTDTTDITSNEGSGIYCINTSLDVTGGTIGSNGSSGVSGVGCAMQFSGVTIENNITTGNGAGINANNAAPTLTNTIVSGNSALGSGGGIYYWGLVGQEMQMTGGSLTDNQAQDGGGLYVAAALAELDNVGVTNNRAMDYGGGIYVNTNNNGSLSLTNGTSVGEVGVGNTADYDTDLTGSGGGIYSRSSIYVQDSSVEENNGAGIYLEKYDTVEPLLVLERSEVNDNTGTGIYSYDSTLVVDQSLISGNENSGIRAAYSLVDISSSTIRDNITSGDGGGVWLSNAFENEIVATTIAGNGAGGFGGGIWLSAVNFELGLELRNSSISGNHADRSGGGVYYSWGEVSEVYLEGVTIASNTADYDDTNDGDGGGIATGLLADGLKLRYSLLADNYDATTGVGVQLGQNCFGGFLSEGYNLVESYDTSVCGIFGGVGDILGSFASPVDPLLGPLQLNGGSTETHALLAGSPAINAGETGACTDIDGDPFIMDQRGVSRPKGLACDMGAYENEYPYWLYLPLVVR